MNYDNVTITGQLDLTRLSGPVRQSVKITNSLFQGPLNFNAVSFDGALDLTRLRLSRERKLCQIEFSE